MIGIAQALVQEKIYYSHFPNLKGKEQKMNKIGTRGFCVFVNDFKGETKIHIRKVIENEEEEGDVIFTKWGVALDPEEYEELKHLIPTINAAVKKQQTRLEGRERTMEKRRAAEREAAEAMASLHSAHLCVKMAQVPMYYHVMVADFRSLHDELRRVLGHDDYVMFNHHSDEACRIHGNHVHVVIRADAGIPNVTAGRSGNPFRSFSDSTLHRRLRYLGLQITVRSVMDEDHFMNLLIYLLRAPRVLVHGGGEYWERKLDEARGLRDIREQLAIENNEQVDDTDGPFEDENDGARGNNANFNAKDLKETNNSRKMSKQCL
ncbi:hypothetical protein AC249_AIPGENE19559 [Exaiptasia diaphana]|nr:hypothetical protein AC249_AIPGENE19559 [Exaiptasia diaphana]